MVSAELSAHVVAYARVLAETWEQKQIRDPTCPDTASSLICLADLYEKRAYKTLDYNFSGYVKENAMEFRGMNVKADLDRFGITTDIVIGDIENILGSVRERAKESKLRGKGKELDRAGQ